MEEIVIIIRTDHKHQSQPLCSIQTRFKITVARCGILFGNNVFIHASVSDVTKAINDVPRRHDDDDRGGDNDDDHGDDNNHDDDLVVIMLSSGKYQLCT